MKFYSFQTVNLILLIGKENWKGVLKSFFKENETN